MKKTLLASVIPAMLFSNAGSATELYADEVNTFSVGGHISAGLVGSEQGDTGVNSVSPRINFAATRDLGNGFTADALVEWSVNMEGGEQALSTRLGYLGLTHDSYGEMVVGTQWAPTYDINGLADIPIAFANENLYNSDMGKLATGRADDMLSYRNSFSLSSDMAINIGVAAQGAQSTDTDDYDARYQAALSLNFSAFTIGATYNAGDVQYQSENRKENATVTKVAAKYGTYGQGLYVAAIYGESEFAYRPGSDTVYAESSDIEALIAYAFENSLNISLNYEEMKDDIEKHTLLNQTALQVEYNFAPNVIGYAGYQVDLGTDLSNKKDNMWMIGARVFL
ncbi:porin [Psychromonas sp. psych-6C06]|uniref:porin n=1 Tax=Psychromonas sp. psych-6C06 TaxID=2058089 RepID=UPI000C34199B|nr:porin [Psychromonas sp. psych-6C06]PKF60694.1 porin [Psychromonas sp. psych-6C06]